jgi:uncharacterized integral membrane protein (TIGR00698 family)
MSDRKSKEYLRGITSIEKNLFGVSVNEVPQLIPGVIIVTLLAWISIWISDYIGVQLLGFDKSPVSPVMAAILLGLMISAVITVPETFKPGLSFAVKKILRLGIILLGIRLTIFAVFRLGIYGIPIVLICITAALLITTQLSKRLGLPERLGALIAVGTSICGVSAIVAASPAIEAEEEQTAYAVAVITIFGILATLVYPYLSYVLFQANSVQSGLFLGTSIHDTSQVVGAAKVYADVYSSPTTLDVAAVTKLVRNLFMAAVIPLIAYYYASRTESQADTAGKKTSFWNLLPLFVLGFLAMALVRSFGDATLKAAGAAYGIWDVSEWASIIAVTSAWASNLLVVALAGVGLSTNFRTFRGLGFEPFLVGFGAALAVGVVSFITILIIGRQVTF